MAPFASCERGFGVEFGLPALDSFVGDLFATAFNGLDSEAIDHLEYVCSDAFGDLQHAPQGLGCKDGGPTQRRIAKDRGDQRLELLVCSPPAQGQLLEPARQLDIAADRFARFIDSETDERDLKSIAQESQRVQEALSRWPVLLVNGATRLWAARSEINGLQSLRVALDTSRIRYSWPT